MNPHKTVTSSDDTPVIERPEKISSLQTVLDIPSSSLFSPELSSWLQQKKTKVSLANIITGDNIVPDASSIKSASFASYRTETVIGGDDRVLANPRENPFNKICALRIRTKNGLMYVGTGWFISSNVLATAGHCVYLHDGGGWADQISVIPFLNGDESGVRSYTARKFHSSEGWVNDRNSDHDYGVIVLDEPVGDVSGWFSFASFPDSDLNTSVVNICGYPLDRDNATRQYIHGRKLVRASERRIYYDIDTFGGQSGCPAYLKLSNGKIYAIGIHTYGGATANYGSRINAEVFYNLQKWKHDPFGS
ncbi:MAG: trypsin-like serine protease [Chitinophagaceae bacterium]|nr:trypsin-like serine protease [Chitinophagaceae bacterium]